MAAGPRLSVVMPVFNAVPHVDAAIESILNQDFADFEFVIFDDGSTDGSSDVLRRWAAGDRRIRFFEGAANLGPVESSNFVVEQARAPVVARMDADDIARPTRLASQKAVFDQFPDVVLVGSLATTIDAEGRTVRREDYARLFRKSSFAPFPHSSIMFRKQAFTRAGGYRRGTEKWEDIDLYLRLAEEGRTVVIAKPLVEVRAWVGSSRSAEGEERFEDAMSQMHLAVGAVQKSVDRVAPDAFIAVGSPLVWQGLRPRLLRRFWRRAARGFNVATLKTLLWVAWADLSPRSLRAFLSARLAVRNLVARRRLGPRTTVEWRPSRAAPRKPSRTPVA